LFAIAKSTAVTNPLSACLQRRCTVGLPLGGFYLLYHNITIIAVSNHSAAAAGAAAECRPAVS